MQSEYEKFLRDPKVIQLIRHAENEIGWGDVSTQRILENLLRSALQYYNFEAL